MQLQRQTPNIPSGTELPKPQENMPVGREVPRTLNAVPGIEGPTIAPEAAQVAPIEKGHTAAPEQKTARVLNNQPVAQPQQQQPDPQPQQPDDAVLQSQAVFDPAVQQSSSTAVAGDNDVIEKEWVNRAKDVVNNTTGNPYEQEKQVSHLQAEYLKKRYGKDIKVPQS